MSKKNTKIEEAQVNVEQTNNEEMLATLLAKVQELEAQLEKAKADNASLIKAKASASQGGERKSQVLTLLKERGPISIKGMAEVLNTTTRNISSVLTGLRNGGYVIHTDGVGQKYLVSEPATTTVIEANVESAE